MTPITGALDAYNCEGVYASRGVSSSAWTCGVVETAYTAYHDGWYSPVYGADSTLAIIYGDSGSPIVDANDGRIAIGILDNSVGNLAHVYDSLTAWGISYDNEHIVSMYQHHAACRVDPDGL